jgi:hypothetical protein
VSAGDVKVGNDLIHVQFQRIGSRLFDDLCELKPRLLRAAIQRPDDGNRDSLFDSTNVFGVLVRLQWIIGGPRKLSEHFGEFTVVYAESGDAILLFERDLLFEQGMEDNSGATRVLQTLDCVEVIPQRKTRLQ